VCGARASIFLAIASTDIAFDSQKTADEVNGLAGSFSGALTHGPYTGHSGATCALNAEGAGERVSVFSAGAIIGLANFRLNACADVEVGDSIASTFLRTE
jgi:hypothetical protein